MQYPGEYPQPLTRTTNVQCPVVASYITARLQVQGERGIVTVAAYGTSTGTLSGFSENLTMVSVHNTGPQDAGFFLLGTDDYVSGPRENLVTVNAGTVNVVRDGHRTLVVYPRHTYMEVKGFTGTSTLRMQLSSRLRWDQLGFDKTDPYYPPFLYNAKNPLTGAV
jgi:hypothetical protein